MTTATTLVPAFFDDTIISKRLLTPERVEQSQAIIVRLRVENDILTVINDIKDPSVVTVVLDTLFGTIGEMATEANAVVTEVSPTNLTMVFLIRGTSQAGRVHEALVTIENILAAVKKRTIPGYPDIEWELSAGVSSGVLNMAVTYNELTDRRLLVYDTPAIKQSDTALELAESGQIVVHRDALKRLGSQPNGKWIKAQYFLPQDSFERSAVAQTITSTTNKTPIHTRVDSEAIAGKTLTLIDQTLVTDIEDYTRGLLLDPLVTVDIRLFDVALLVEEDLDRWQVITDRVLGTVERYGGIFTHIDQDMIQLVFHGDTTLDKIAQRAVSCGLAIKRALQSVNVEARMSITAGPAYIGLTGSTLNKHCLVLGESVRSAKSILYESDKYEIIVTEAIKYVTQQEFSWRQLKDSGNYTLTGEVTLGSGLVTRIKAKSETPLFERGDVIGKISDIVDKAQEGKVHLMLMAGERGTGRSSMVDALIAHWLRADGNGFLSIGPSNPPATPYALWIPIWQAIFGLTPEATAQQNYEALETAVYRLLPESSNATALFADVLGLSKEASDQVSGLSPRVRLQRLIQANIDLLRYLSQLTPVLLVFEHVEFADSLSIELMERLSPALEDSNVLMCVEDRGNPMHSLKDELSSATIVNIKRLTGKGAWQLFQYFLPEVDWPYSYRKALEERLGEPDDETPQTSPDYIVMLARSLRAGVVGYEGKGLSDEYPPQDWPRTVPELALFLSKTTMRESTREILVRATAGGMLIYHQFPWLKTSSTPEPTFEIEQLQKLNIIKPFIDFGHTQRWDHFSHEFVRMSIYRNMDPTLRKEVHGQIAEWYAEHQPGLAGQAAVAYHYQQGGYVRKAVSAYLKASDHASAWGAESEASQHLLAAERLVTQHGMVASARTQVYLGWAKLRMEQGKYERALTDVDRAFATADTLSDTELLARSLVMRARIEHQLGDLDQAMIDASTAARLTVRDQSIRARALWVQALIAFDQDKRQQAARFLTRALNMEAVTDYATLIEMELDAARIFLADYQRDAARTYIMRAYQRAEILNDPILLQRVQASRGHILLLYGVAEDSIEALEDAIGLPPPRDAGLADLGDLLVDYAVALCYAGRYPDAEAAFDTAITYYIDEPDKEKREHQLNVLRISELLIDQQRLDEAQQMLEELKPHREGMEVFDQYLFDLTNADLCIRCQDLDQAKDILDNIEKLESSSSIAMWFEPFQNIRQAELALAKDDLESAYQYAIKALGAVSLQGDIRVLTIAYTLVAESKILDNGRQEVIQDALERAVRNGRQQGRRLHLARALYLLGKYMHHTSLRDSTRARSNTRIFEAEGIYREMDLTPEENLPKYILDFWQEETPENTK